MLRPIAACLLLRAVLMRVFSKTSLYFPRSLVVVLIRSAQELRSAQERAALLVRRWIRRSAGCRKVIGHAAETTMLYRNVSLARKQRRQRPSPLSPLLILLV